MGVSINLMVKDKLKEVKEEYLSFSRERDYIKDTKIDKANGILNHMRVFSVNAFMFISQTEWRDVYGVYFQDRIIVLGSLLELLVP